MGIRSAELFHFVVGLEGKLVQTVVDLIYSHLKTWFLSRERLRRYIFKRSLTATYIAPTDDNSEYNITVVDLSFNILKAHATAVRIYRKV